MILNKREQAFLKEVQGGVRGYLHTYTDESGLQFIDSEDIPDSLAGVVIDAAYFNGVEDTMCEALVGAMIGALKDCESSTLVSSVRLVASTLE